MTAVPLAIRAQAELELRRRRRRQPPIPDQYGAWLETAHMPWSWDFPHFHAMQAVLDDVTAGRVLRAFFSIPIRHGKSEHNTIRYPAYRLKKDATTRFLVGSYNQSQANRFSRAALRVTREVGVPLSPQTGISDWATAAGGGMIAVGAGAGVASVNADVIIIDDPLGSRDDAESQAKRDQVWDWITNDLLARAEPHTAVIFTMSRWHQDDPAGRLLDGQAGKWHVLDLPAEAEDDDPLGRQPGEPLWPAFRSAQWLEEKRTELGEYGFASLLQGRPRPREGGMFKWAWWLLLDAIPASGPMVRYWDLAGTRPKGGSSDPDWTAGALLCRMPDQRTAVVQVSRFRRSVAERDAEMERQCREDLAQYGGRVRWWLERDSGIAGSERTTALVRRLQNCGMPVYTEVPTGSKELRAEPLASAAEAGNVVLCPGPWRDGFRAEAADFPTGKHDDQVDAAAGAFAKLGKYDNATVTTYRI
jgi:predicted phage terminase large subunit-like protein